MHGGGSLQVAARVLEELLGVGRADLEHCTQLLDAIRQEEAALVSDVGEAALHKPSSLPQDPPVINNYRVKDLEAAEDQPSEEEFEEDLEEEVVDRDALKKQSGTILDKATKKTKKRKKGKA